MWVTLALKAQDFMGGLAAADKQAAGFAQRIQSGLGGALTKISQMAKKAFVGIGVAAVAGFGMLIGSSIQTNAQLESTTLQFETLIGNADAAREHVGDLFDFAKRTPFETGPIIEASKMMRTFGGDVLDTQANLLLVGDAAAATNAPINELGFWVGRLYSNIQAGQPFGEAAMRLQELAVMSPQARQEMEALQKSGAGANEVFSVFQGDLGRFTGAMEKQAGTWQGLWSTLKDQVQLMTAEAFKPFFDTGKEGMTSLIDLLNDPALTEGLADLAHWLGELFASDASGIEGIVSIGLTEKLAKENDALMKQLGLTRKEMTQLEKDVQRQMGLAWADLLDPKVNLKFEEGIRASIEAIDKQTGSVLLQTEAYRGLNAARMDGPDPVPALEAEAAAMQIVAVTAEGLDWALRNNAYMVEDAAVATTDFATDLDVWGGNAEIARHQAMELGAALGYDAEAATAAAAAVQAYNEAFQAVQGDYTNQLPGADQPLVTPARDVAITTGGLSSEQVALLEQYQEEARKAQQEIYNLTNGLGTYGLEQEKVNERVLAAQGELEHYNALMAPLTAVVGETSIAHQGLAVNIGAVYQGIYDQLGQMGAAPEVMTAFAVATGIMSEAQAEAALQAAAVKVKIDELAVLIAEGMPVETALADLDKFIAKITGEVAPAVARAAADVPAHVVEMKERMGEEALLAGAGLMTGMETGMVDNQHLATEAATAAGDEVIRATGAALGVESPSTITHAMGLDLMAGMQNGANEGVGAVVAALTTIGGNIIAGLVAGINAAKETVRAAIQGITDLIPQWLRDMLGIHSPARATIPIGRAVVEGIAEGVIYNERTLQTALRKLTTMLLGELDLGDQIAGIAGGFAARFEEQITGPMAERLNELDKQLAGAAALYNDTMRAAGREDVFADWADPAQLRAARLQLAELRNVLGGEGDWLGAMQASEALATLDRRNQLNEEYIRQQERLAELQRAQADMAFLRSQVELLALIAEHADELPADLLAGVEFGSEADPGALMDAMTAVLEQQVAEVNGALAESRPLQQLLTEGLDAPEFIKQIRPAHEEWRDFTGAVKEFHGWLSGRSFKLDVRIGKIPDWAIPGSPLPIHVAWVNFAEAMQHLYFGDQLVTHFGRIATSGDLLMTFLMNMPEELEGLTEDINAIVFQNFEAFNEYFEIVQAGGEGLQELLNAFADYAEGEPLSDMFQELLGSFPEEFLPFLEQLAQMVADGVEGVQEYVASLVELAGAVEGLEGQLDLARTVGNLAAGFANYFEIQVLRPLENSLNGTNDVLAGMMQNLAETAWEEFGNSSENLHLDDILAMPTDEAIRAIQGVRHALVAAGSVEGQAQADAIIEALIERNRLEREYEEQQQRILRLEEQRAQLAFLQQQLDLIRLVMEEGLDASILSGLQFGLYADAGQLMDVMAAVMQELILTAQNELMIHSPSRPFVEFGENAMQSMAIGIEGQADALQQTMEQGMDAALEPMRDAVPEPALMLGAMMMGMEGQIDALHQMLEEGMDEALEPIRDAVSEPALALGAMMSGMEGQIDALHQMLGEGMGEALEPIRDAVSEPAMMLGAMMMGMEGQAYALRQMLARGMDAAAEPLRDFASEPTLAAGALAMGLEDRAERMRRMLERGTEEATIDPLNDSAPISRAADGRTGRVIINGGYHVTITGSDGDALEQLQRQTRGGRSLSQRLVEVI